MSNIKIKNADEDNKYLKAEGVGTDIDPLIPIHKSEVINIVDVNITTSEVLPVSISNPIDVVTPEIQKVDIVSTVTQPVSIADPIDVVTPEIQKVDIVSTVTQPVSIADPIDVVTPEIQKVDIVSTVLQPVSIADPIDVVTPEIQKVDIVSTVTQPVSIADPINLATNDLGRNAWGIPKVTTDHTLFSGLWTYDVPKRVWYAETDIGSGYSEVDIDSTYITSKHGHLAVIGESGINTFLSTKRHPRYQPNRGLLFSTAVIFPTPNIVAKRRFGHGTHENGFYFQLEGIGSNAILTINKRTNREGTIDVLSVDITSFLPNGFDFSKGHVYDIQEEWRGVGNIFVYVDLKLIFTYELLGTLTEMSVSNPALPVFFEVLDASSPVEIHAGCVDVSSEGGHIANKTYASVNTGTLLLTTSNAGKAILAVKVPKKISYNGVDVLYTRDMILTEMSTFCKDEAFRSVYIGRSVNLPNLDGLVDWTKHSDSFFEILNNSNGNLNDAFQLDKSNMSNIYSTRNEKDFSSIHNNPNPQQTDFYLTAGDILIVEIKSDANSVGGCTLEFAEEV